MDYTWNLGNVGGDWTTAGNWSPSGVPGTVAADVATLTDTGANRTIVLTPTAATTIATLNFNQATAGFTNTLELRYNQTAVATFNALTVTNAIVLGATGGTEELRITPTGSSGTVALVATGGITIQSGGRLVLGVNATNNNAVSQLSGNVNLTSGGQLVITDSIGTGGAAQRAITGTLVATGGSIAIGSNPGRPNEARLSIGGNFSATDTTISGSGDSQLLLIGATNSIGTGSTFGPGITIGLNSGSDQTLTSAIKLNGLFLRTATNGTVIKTVTVNTVGQNIGGLLFASGAGTFTGTLGLKLGSNLTTVAGAVLPQMSGVNQTGASPIFSIDSAGFTLDLSNTVGVWNFNRAGNGVNDSVTWALTNSGTGGAGAIKANGFNLTGTTTNVNVNVGAGAVLEAVGGNGLVNNLGGTGTIAATSLFRYTGSAAASTPSTLTSNRTIGQLEIGNGTTASALSLAGNVVAAGAVTVKNLGSFDLGTSTLTASTGLALASGGSLRGGNAGTAGTVSGDVVSSGTVAPGTTPAATGTTVGSLAISGALAMNTGSTFALEIVSASAFDKVLASGVSLNGTVNLALTLGASYAHVLGSTFLILENTGVGNIAGTSGLLTWSGPEGVLSQNEVFSVSGNSFQINYAGNSGNDVVLTAVVPEPSALLALFGGAGMLLGLGRRRRSI